MFDIYMICSKLVESLLKHKSRVKWLELGDNNNAFFHRSLLIKRIKNTFRRIINEDESILIDEDGICMEAENYFTNILALTPLSLKIWLFIGILTRS